MLKRRYKGLKLAAYGTGMAAVMAFSGHLYPVLNKPVFIVAGWFMLGVSFTLVSLVKLLEWRDARDKAKLRIR